MGHYKESQYDDDLTLDAEEYDDYFETSDIDLFAFAGEDDSPISRLKTLVLSLDWEITDTVLLQFNDEILDLKDFWADDKVYMIYLQALEKIGKYIYREKADAHPNSIRLLLSMYYNLERLVLSDELDEAEKKQILVQDVRRFEKLKKLITKPSTDDDGPDNENGGDMAEDVAEVMVEQQTNPELIELKALVLGIDWEVTEQQLLDLQKEVKKLQASYADSRPRLVFLQGIGTLGAYIRKRKADSHQDAFKILRSFFDGLEEIVQTPGISLDGEKRVLLPEVKKFEAFKKIIEKEKSAPTKGPAPAPGSAGKDSAPAAGSVPAIAPAFSDLPEDSVRGFQEEEEAAALGLDKSGGVDERLSTFFSDEKKSATEKQALTLQSAEEKEVEAFSESFFGADTGSQGPAPSVDRELALQGVDVETEADDDSDEEELPFFGGEIAPALADSDEVSSFSEPDSFSSPAAMSAEPAAASPTETPAVPEVQSHDDTVEPANEIEPVPPAATFDSTEEEIGNRLDSLFGIGDNVKTEKVAPSFSSTSAEVALQGVEVEAEGDDVDGDEIEPITGPALDGLEARPKSQYSSGFEAPADEMSPATPVGSSTEEIEFEPEEPQAELFPEEKQQAFEEEFDEPPASPAIKSSEPAPAFSSLEFDEEIGNRNSLTEGEDENEVVSAVESQLDRFFNFGEPEQDPAEAAGEEQSGVESFEEEIEKTSPPEGVSTDEITLPLSVDENLADELQEEEVVFALAEDDELVAEEPIAEFEQVIDGPITVAEEETEPESKLQEIAVAAELEQQGIPQDDIAGQDIMAEDLPVAGASEIAVEAAKPAFQERVSPYVDLRGCIQSLDLQLDDAIISGLYTELEQLREYVSDKPVEKSYLQLISTVCMHIDKFRYNSDDRSNALLLAIMDDLEQASATELAVAQEALLVHTGEVLHWQHEMLAAAAEARARSEASQTKPDASKATGYTATAEADPFAGIADESGRVVGETLLSDKQLADVVRREIDTLRDTLRSEIKELRKAMQGGH